MVASLIIPSLGVVQRYSGGLSQGRLTIVLPYAAIVTFIVFLVCFYREDLFKVVSERQAFGLLILIFSFDIIVPYSTFIIPTIALLAAFLLARRNNAQAAHFLQHSAIVLALPVVVPLLMIFAVGNFRLPFASFGIMFIYWGTLGFFCDWD